MYNPYQAQIDQIDQKIEEARTFLDSEDEILRELATAELNKLETEKAQLEQSAQEFAEQLSADGGEHAAGSQENCTIELRSGAGGDEAKIWAHDILRMYIRFIEKIGLKFTYIDDLVIKVKGKTSDLPELLLENESNINAYELFKHESGVHRVQRVPETESQGRIHTSTCTVAVLPEVASNAIEIRDEDIEWQFMRSSGAGGQSVNKTSSAVRLTHLPSGIVVTSRQEKKQEQNRKIALELLRAQLWEIEEEKRLEKIGKARSAIGRARRSEKIRTYNFPQNRITDHRTKQSWHNLPEILDGSMQEMLTELIPALRKLEAESEID